MSSSVANLQAAQAEAAAKRPPVQGFPVLAETLRRRGVRHTEWLLPAMQSTYLTNLGPVVDQGEPLLLGLAEVAPFNQKALVAAIRADQAGEASFPEFAALAWAAGVVRWTVDLGERVCTYYGADGESFVESYPAVALPDA